MKRVLILTYYWPPSGGSGVQRWLKFTRYLREFGWEPVIYTAKDAEYPVLDESLEKEIPAGVEILRTPIWEPYKLYKWFTGQKKDQRVVSGFLTEEKKSGLKSKISVWIRGNFFIPDARKFWINPSVRFLKKYLLSNPVHAIVSTGPPHSMHIIAKKLKKATGLPWLADFRDPWTNIDFYKDLNLSRRADNKHKKLEKEVLEQADKIVVVGNQMKLDFEIQAKGKTLVITNGYDEKDKPGDEISPAREFSLVHIGMLNKDRNHPAFWEALKELAFEEKEFSADLRLTLIGKTDISARKEIEKSGLSANTRYIDYLKHSDAVKEQFSASLLLLFINNSPNAKGVITGKIFEYLASGRPVLCIGPPDGDAAAILNESGAGATLGFSDKEGIKKVLKNYYLRYKEGNLRLSPIGIEKFSRRSLTEKMAEALNGITE